MCSCESSSVRTSGRRMARMRRPRTLKSNISYVFVMCRGGDCAAKVLDLTWGGPWMWSHDNCDLDGLSKPGRGRDAFMEVGRTHSSRQNDLPKTCMVTCGEGKTDRKRSQIRLLERRRLWRRRGEHNRRQTSALHANERNMEKVTANAGTEPPAARGGNVVRRQMAAGGMLKKIGRQPLTTIAR
jgi:hypothetical protein